MKYGPIILDDQQAIKDMVGMIIFGEPVDWGPSYSLGFLDGDGILEAGVVFSNYNRKWRRVEVSGASLSSTWMSIPRMNVIADYVFNQLNCYSLVSRHSPSNKTVRRLWTTLGGTEVMLPNVRGPGEHEIMHIITVDEAKQSKFWRL